MARIDKTDSAIGMQRVEAGWAADAAAGELDNVRGVGINTTGKAVVGAGNTGIKGLSVRSKIFRRAGDLAEYCSTGEIVEIEGLTAGTNYFVNPATGLLTDDAASGANTPVGYTIEADRLIVRL